MFLRTLFLMISVAFVNAQKRHIYLGTRSLIVPGIGGGTIEYLKADGLVDVIAHWAVLFSECGTKSPQWKPESTKPLGTLVELNANEQSNNYAKITTHF